MATPKETDKPQNANTQNVPSAQGSADYEREHLERPDHRQHEIDIERNRASQFNHPLIASTGEIRLVRIRESSSSLTIGCDFVLSLVDNTDQPFTALSYLWGVADEPSSVVKINLHNQVFWVRKNLWDFLNHARADSSLQSRLFWIDALCINQAGTGDIGFKEKNQQVGMMKDIYSNAREVISWLGEPDEIQRRDMELISKFLADPHIFETSHPTFFLGPLSHIFRHDYWTRIWVIQEVLLARRVILRYGSFAWQWNDVKTLNYWYYNFRDCFPENLPTYRDNSWRLIFYKLEKRKSNLARVLVWFKGFQSTNPLDHIYGLLGNLEDDQVPIMPDYTLSVVQLYEHIVRYGLRNSKLEQPTDFCDDWCFFLSNLGKSVLGLDEKQIREVHTRLTEEMDLDWHSLHPFSEKCNYHFTVSETTWKLVTGGKKGEFRRNNTISQ